MKPGKKIGKVKLKIKILKSKYLTLKLSVLIIKMPVQFTQSYNSDSFSDVVKHIIISQ